MPGSGSAPDAPNSRNGDQSGNRKDSNQSSEGASPPSKKRRTSATASRGVANLTPEQLAKKRANDREAQRAIRERTKTQIETLENRIHELVSQSPYQELRRVLHEKELVDAENQEIKRQLGTVLSILQPLVGKSEYNGNAPLPFPQSAINLQTKGNVDASTSPQERQWHQQVVPMTGPRGPALHVASPYGVFDQQRQNLSPSGDRLPVEFLLDGSQHVGKMMNGNAPQYGPQASPLVLNGASPSTSQAGGENRNILPQIESITDRPLFIAHSTPIKNTEPSCPLDSLLLDFLAERQQQAAKGVPEHELIGPAYPSIATLLNPDRPIISHPLSKVFTDILRAFPDLSEVPEKIAVLYVMFLIMRWQIAPTQENYDRLPDWVTPRPSQLFTPHPAWIDHLPWPRLRDILVRKYREYPLDNFFIPFTTTLSLNWPYDHKDCMMPSSIPEEIDISPAFERHLRNLNNWSLGPAFASSLPVLAAGVKIKVDGEVINTR